MPVNDNAALREQLVALMAMAPMPDYSVDSIVASRLGKLLTDLADGRANLRRSEGACRPTKVTAGDEAAD